MSSAMPHGPHQPSSMIVVAPNRNQSVMVASVIIMTILVIVTVGLLLWILVSGRAVTHQEHDSVLLQNQEMATTSADQAPPRAVPVPAAPVEASTSTNSGETRRNEATTVSLLRPRGAAATTMRAWRTITAATCRYAGRGRNTFTGHIPRTVTWNYLPPKSVPATT